MYTDLRTYKQTEIICDLTADFCRRYVPATSRTRDQMDQAARSGKQNLAEGATQSKTWPKNELNLINIAYGSLKELLEDYLDFLRQRKLSIWDKNDSRAIAIRNLAYQNQPESSPSYTSYKYYKSYTSSTSYATYAPYLANPETAANAMIVLINQTNFLLYKQMQAVKLQLKDKGIELESHTQRVARIYNEKMKREKEFDEYLKTIIEKSKKEKNQDQGAENEHKQNSAANPQS